MLSYFDVHVINLPARTDRRAEMKREMERIGHRWDDVHVFDAIRPDDAGPFPSVGARGCFLSHLAVLKKAHGKPQLICEDDLKFTRDRDLLINTIGDLDRSEWDIFYGGRQTEGAHMIAFHPRCIARLVAYLEAMLDRPAGDPAGGPMHVDGAYKWFSKEPGIIVRHAMPPLGNQRRSRTDIHALKWHDRTPVVAQAVAALRRVLS
jgi:hypothetical protein